MATGTASPMLTLFTAIQSRQVEARLEEAQVVAQLVRRCASGDPVAWEEIVQRFHRRIYNICYRFAGSADDAQDLTQEVFIKVFRTVGSFDGEKASFNTWMTTVARNLLVDHFRKTRNDRATDSIDALQGADEDGDGTPGFAADLARPARSGDLTRSAGYGLSGDSPGSESA